MHIHGEYALDECTVLNALRFGSIGAYVHISLTGSGQTHILEKRWLHLIDVFNMVGGWEEAP